MVMTTARVAGCFIDFSLLQAHRSQQAAGDAAKRQSRLDHSSLACRQPVSILTFTSPASASALRASMMMLMSAVRRVMGANRGGCCRQRPNIVAVVEKLKRRLNFPPNWPKWPSSAREKRKRENDLVGCCVPRTFDR